MVASSTYVKFMMQERNVVRDSVLSYKKEKKKPIA
jgi:hypothetical protein